MSRQIFPRDIDSLPEGTKLKCGTCGHEADAEMFEPGGYCELCEDNHAFCPNCKDMDPDTFLVEPQ